MDPSEVEVESCICTGNDSGVLVVVGDKQRELKPRLGMEPFTIVVLGVPVEVLDDFTGKSK